MSNFPSNDRQIVDVNITYLFGSLYCVTASCSGTAAMLEGLPGSTHTPPLCPFLNQPGIKQCQTLATK